MPICILTDDQKAVYLRKVETYNRILNTTKAEISKLSDDMRTELRKLGFQPEDAFAKLKDCVAPEEPTPDDKNDLDKTLETLKESIEIYQGKMTEVRDAQA